MLINCPECNKEISDKSKTFIHCGFPLNTNNICLVNGKEYDLSFLLNDSEYIDKLVEFVQLTDCYFGDSSEEITKIIENKKIPDILNIKTNEQFKQQANSNKPKCPTCDSTKLSKVSTISKASSVVLWGLFSQKVKKTWHCNNCGYEW